MLIPKSYWRIFVTVIFDIVFSVHVYYAFFLISSPLSHPWLIGDWLINYQGGFVRRGLIGEVCLRISHLLNINIVVVVVIFQMIIYLFFLISTYRLSINSYFSALTASLIFSPAFILFPILDSDSPFRKEILLFALLSGLCYHLTFSKPNISGNLPVYTGIFSAVIVLNHEMLAFYLPYVVCAFMIHEKGFGVKTKRAVLSMIPAMIILLFLVTIGRGGSQVVNDICASLKIYAPPDCVSPDVVPGSISFLGKDLPLAHSYVLDSINETTILTYTLTAILSFTPLVLIYFSTQFAAIRKNSDMRFWIFLCVFSTIMGTVPLFWIVADYGRIIYIHVSCLSLLALMAAQDDNNASLHLDFRQVIAWLLCFIYMGSWRLIHWNASIDTGFPFIKLMLDQFVR